MLLAAAVAVAVAPVALGGTVVITIAAVLSGADRPSATSICAAPGSVAVARGIDDWIAVRVPESPLRATGAQMTAAVAGTGLDPRLLAAIAMQETRLGTRGGGPAVFNPFGLGPQLAFPNWMAAMRLAVATLVGMHDAGAVTILQLGAHWAPVGAANDPTGLNSGWVAGVAASYASLGGDPAGSVFGPARVAACPSPVAPRPS